MKLQVVLRLMTTYNLVVYMSRYRAGSVEWKLIYGWQARNGLDNNCYEFVEYSGTGSSVAFTGVTMQDHARYGTFEWDAPNSEFDEKSSPGELLYYSRDVVVAGTKTEVQSGGR